MPPESMVIVSVVVAAFLVFMITLGWVQRRAGGGLVHADKSEK